MTNMSEKVNMKGKHLLVVRGIGCRAHGYIIIYGLSMIYILQYSCWTVSVYCKFLSILNVKSCNYKSMFTLSGSHTIVQYTVIKFNINQVHGNPRTTDCQLSTNTGNNTWRWYSKAGLPNAQILDKHSIDRINFQHNCCRPVIWHYNIMSVSLHSDIHHIYCKCGDNPT